MRIKFKTWIFFIILIGVFSCAKNEKQENNDFSISLRIPKEPSFLNPLKSVGSTDIIINQYIFLPLANYHPFDLNLIPVLIEKIPEGIPIDTGYMKGTIRFDCTIRQEAKWDNGEPITGHDYVFTIKAIKHANTKVVPSIKGIFKQLITIHLNPNNSRKFSVFVSQNFHLAKELALITEILPEYIYDKNQALRNTNFTQNGELSMGDTDTEKENLISEFISFFNHSNCGRKIVSGSGPYKMTDWQTNQKVQLTRKNNWWGTDIPNNPYLENHPKDIIFKVFPDLNSSITALKNNTLDFIGKIDGANFSKLQNSEKYKSKLDFLNPLILQYYFIGINNHDILLRDKNIRKALAHLIDINAFIQNFEHGNGFRLNAPILPSREYYNDELENIPFDIDKAKSYLSDSGWKDSDSDGILDKVIDGEKTDLSIEILLTGKMLGKNLALLLKERAKEAGIDIEIITKHKKIINQDISKRNFDLHITGTILGLYPPDLYQNWHSDNDVPGGSNKYGFNNFEVDQIIEKIRASKDSLEINRLFKEVQSKIYDEQPMIFLYSPSNNIVFNKKFTGKATIKKPGYFINTFKLSAEQ